jgi:hypothetical protein
MNVRPVLALVLAAAATGLTACSTAPATPKAAAPAPSPSWPRLSCSLAAPSVVQATLGQTVNDPQEVHQDPVTVCTYLQKNNKYAVVVRFQTNADEAIFTAGKSSLTNNKQKVQDITGFQDEAYASTVTAAGTTTNTLAARKGTVLMVVTSTASVDQEKALETKVMSSL